MFICMYLKGQLVRFSRKSWRAFFLHHLRLFSKVKISNFAFIRFAKKLEQDKKIEY